MAPLVGARMRRARLARGLTLEETAERLRGTITKAGISKYELGKSDPDPEFLGRFARVCEVAPSYFLREAAATVEWLAYRKHARIGARRLGRVRAFAEERVEAFLRLREAIRPSETPEVPRRMTVTRAEEVERAATRLRAEWGLAEEPIENLCATLEHRGWIVVGWKGENGFDGLSGRLRDDAPVVVMNLRSPGDRRRLALAHEVGHLLLGSRGGDAREEEGRMNRFASALLAPEAAVRRELGPRRTRLELGELVSLKREYGLSMQGWLRRARDLEIVPASEHLRWTVEFRKRGWHRLEPVEDRRDETPSRLCRLALHGLAERLVDEDWVRRFCPDAIRSARRTPDEEGSPAERLLRLPPEKRAPILAAQAEEARGAYASDSERTVFTATDGEPFLEGA